MEVFGIGLLIVIGIIGYFQINKGKSNQLVVGEFLPEWRIVLIEKVAFYNGLSAEDKTWFESDILHFLSHVRITGIDVKVDETDRILVAASAVIPIFAFKEWRYNNITEVLLYPSSFNEKFETAGADRRILGMVGEGPMNGTMIPPRP